jgi:hypothetical protein
VLKPYLQSSYELLQSNWVSWPWKHHTWYLGSSISLNLLRNIPVYFWQQETDCMPLVCLFHTMYDALVQWLAVTGGVGTKYKRCICFSRTSLTLWVGNQSISRSTFPFWQAIFFSKRNT